jgi:hypothetical protein
MGVERWKCEVSTPSLTLPLQGVGDVEENEIFVLKGK